MQGLEGDTDPILVAIFQPELTVQKKRITVAEVHAAVLEAPNPDLRALQIANDADVAANVAGELSHEPDAVGLLLGSAAEHPAQVACHITGTTPEGHALIRANLDRAPLYSGQIRSTGPRYCPSIEDKVVRFADKDGHQLFLEPEGRHTREVYVNGLPTSLPRDVQDAIFRLIRERAVVLLADVDRDQARGIFERLCSDFSGRFAPSTGLEVELGYFQVMAEPVSTWVQEIFDRSPRQAPRLVTKL